MMTSISAALRGLKISLSPFSSTVRTSFKSNPTIEPLAEPEAAALTVQGTLNCAERVFVKGERLSKDVVSLKLTPLPSAVTTVPLLVLALLTAKG